MNMLSLKEAAARAGIPERTFAMRVTRGRIASSKPAGRIMIDPADLEASITAELLVDAVEATAGKSAVVIYAQLRNVLAALPQAVKERLLGGV